MTIIIVNPGQNIRDVYDTAQAGDTIQTNAGTYQNQSEINPRGGINLLGIGKVLIYPNGNFIVSKYGAPGNFSVKNIEVVIPASSAASVLSLENGCHDLLFEDCIFSGGRNTIQIVGNSIQNGAWTGKADSNNIAINRCVIHGPNNHSGIDLFGNVHHIMISNNVFYKVVAMVFTHQGLAQYITIYNNCGYNVFEGIYPAEGIANSRIEKNTVWNVRDTINGLFTPSASNGGLNIRLGKYGGGTRNNTIKDNIIFDYINIEGTGNSVTGNNFNAGFKGIMPQPSNFVSPTTCGEGNIPIEEAPKMISNIITTSGRIYGIDTLAVGKTLYTDRIYQITGFPAKYAGLEYIKTASDDKYLIADNSLQFDINSAATVYVAYDDRIFPKPLWLSAFADTGDDLIRDSTITYSIYSKSFLAGHITLGGTGLLGGSGATYIVIAEPIQAPPPPPPPPPTKVNVTAFSAGNGQVMAYNDPTRIGNSYSLLLDSGAPWTFTALPAQGYQFEKWTDSNGTITTTIEISGTAISDITYTASFIPVPPPPPPIPPQEFNLNGPIVLMLFGTAAVALYEALVKKR